MKEFKTFQGRVFKILESRFYPLGEIAKQHRRYLGALKPNLLVGVKFYGKIVPVITTTEGVNRILKIEVDGKICARASDISRVLGALKPRIPLEICELRS